MRTERRGHVARGLDGDGAFLREREERFGRLFGDQRQVGVFPREGPLVGPAQQEQRFGEVDRSRVHGVEAVEKLPDVSVRIVAGDVQKCLGDRERRPQLVGRVGGESLLFGDVGFESREHRVEGVGELAELVLPAFELDPMGQRSVAASRAASVIRVSGVSIRPARIQPPTRPNTSRNTSTSATRGVKARTRSDRLGKKPPGPTTTPSGHVAKKEQPDHAEEDDAGDHQESGVAERELEPNAHPRPPTHCPLPRAPCLLECRCGIRPRAPWGSPTARRAACGVPRR